GFGGNDNFG
nr:Chain A, GLY-PHE-GLY-GLY-ASN-ASP-ASN-PHE-GLY [Homo sapiens]6J60_A Chain A, 9-mer peptide (GFGGNDNFG) from Heterogeneous nuclear ribonucleoprotein A1 [Homo sapiens]